MASRQPRSRRDRPHRTWQPLDLERLEQRLPLTTFTVTQAAGDRTVAGSLPWAVFQANYFSKGPDVVRFNLPAASRTITLAEPLYLNEQIVVDGLSQPGSTPGTPAVTVRGSAAVSSLFILQNDPAQKTTSTGSTIQGLALAEYSANAITVFRGSTGNTIQFNWIGFSVAAGGTVRKTATSGTHQAAIGIQSSGNTIRQNTIAGVYNGINIGEDIGRPWSGAVYSGNTIAANRIGTNPAGTSAAGYGNLSDGIFLGAGAQRNRIGPDNVLSGNASAGVEIFHSSAVGNVVFRNRIGTDAAGQVAIRNGELGVLVANGATGNTIGGTLGGNVIAGNRLGGVALGTASYPGARANVVQNNVIGMNASRSAALDTQNVGISVDSRATANSITDNEIGGHALHGIIMAQTTANTVSRNQLGRTTAGRLIPNRGFGMVLLAGANSNTGTGNVYGSNALGRIWVDRAAVGNRIA